MEQHTPNKVCIEEDFSYLIGTSKSRRYLKQITKGTPFVKLADTYFNRKCKFRKKKEKNRNEG